jgi:hypothetical protein
VWENRGEIFEKWQAFWNGLIATRNTKRHKKEALVGKRFSSAQTRSPAGQAH